jgi:DNA topoisomerase-3
MTLLQSGLLLFFYDDCSVANTTVIGKAADVAFKTKGNFTKGWRIVFEDPKKEKEGSITDFIKGEKGHPRFERKLKHKSVRRGPWKPQENMNDEDLRELMKENGMDVRQHERY